MLSAKRNSVDLKFHYSNVVRHLFISQLNHKNFMSLPKLKMISLNFSLKDLMDQEDPQARSFAYFFKFFFGYEAFVTNRRSVFSLGVTYYSFDVQIFVQKCDFFRVLNFISNDIIPFLEAGYSSFYRIGDFTALEVTDTSIFTEKKTNAALFDLKNPLVTLFNFNIPSKTHRDLFFSSLKIFLKKNVF